MSWIFGTHSIYLWLYYNVEIEEGNNEKWEKDIFDLFYSNVYGGK